MGGGGQAQAAVRKPDLFSTARAGLGLSSPGDGSVGRARAREASFPFCAAHSGAHKSAPEHCPGLFRVFGAQLCTVGGGAEGHHAMLGLRGVHP